MWTLNISMWKLFTKEIDIDWPGIPYVVHQLEIRPAEFDTSSNEKFFGKERGTHVPTGNRDIMRKKSSGVNRYNPTCWSYPTHFQESRNRDISQSGSHTSPPTWGTGNNHGSYRVIVWWMRVYHCILKRRETTREIRPAGLKKCQRGPPWMSGRCVRQDSKRNQWFSFPVLCTDGSSLTFSVIPSGSMMYTWH